MYLVKIDFLFFTLTRNTGSGIVIGVVTKVTLTISGHACAVVKRVEAVGVRHAGVTNDSCNKMVSAHRFWFNNLPFFVITGRNEVVAKVMFLHVCVCPQGEGVCLSACWDARPLPPGSRPPQTRQTPPGPGRPPRTRQTPPYQADPWDQADPPGTRQTPPGSRLQHTVYERPVCILLECILVNNWFHIKSFTVYAFGLDGDQSASNIFSMTEFNLRYCTCRCCRWLSIWCKIY